MSNVLTTQGVAALLGCSVTKVKKLDEMGRLRPTERLSDGRRVYSRDSVERFAVMELFGREDVEPPLLGDAQTVANVCKLIDRSASADLSTVFPIVAAIA